MIRDIEKKDVRAKGLEKKIKDSKRLIDFQSTAHIDRLFTPVKETQKILLNVRKNTEVMRVEVTLIQINVSKKGKRYKIEFALINSHIYITDKSPTR